MPISARWFLLILCVSVPAFAQSGSASSGSPAESDRNPSYLRQGPVLSQRPPPALLSKIPEGRILLDVVVTDDAGKPASGLLPQDFTILDNNQPQKVVSFQAIGAPEAKGHTPVEIFLLIDTVNSSFERVAYLRKQIATFLRQDGGHLTRPVSLILFSDAGAKIQNRPSMDGNALAAVLDQNATAIRTIGPAAGSNGATERFSLSIQTLTSLVANEGKKPGRKILVWIGQGWPMLAAPELGFSSRTHQLFFDSIVNLSNGLREARITLYSVDLLDLSAGTMTRRFFYQDFLKPVETAKEADSGNLAVRVLATQSGGRVLNSSGDVAAQLTRCVEDASAFYTLSFNPDPAGQTIQHHQLRVMLSKPALTARTNTGYYDPQVRLP